MVGRHTFHKRDVAITKHARQSKEDGDTALTLLS